MARDMTKHKSRVFELEVLLGEKSERASNQEHCLTTSSML